MGATSGAGSVYPSGSSEFTPVYSGVRVTRILNTLLVSSNSAY